MKYLTSIEISKIWGVSERSVRNYCASGRVVGAYLKGKTWMIPENATKPKRQNRHSKKMPSLLDVLSREKEHSVKGGIYHKLQIELTYNSNHMEGSKLTHDETRYIYETKTIGLENKSVKIDDIIETVNHFRCVDLSIESAKRRLSESFIKQLHLVLKTGTSEAREAWFKVGDYKLLPNQVGLSETTEPEQVKIEMKKLLDNYNQKEKHSFEEIVEFHVKFERIHPFQDGNGRVGRLISFKECLKNDIVPFIILDSKKEFYYRGLKNWNQERGWLIDTCLDGQDTVKAYLDYFSIQYK
ncbi:MAG: Fic family protein [Erysipelotrichaceae bacterium]|nr:Fic family protein [Erysipelotrichaceae bacterium]